MIIYSIVIFAMGAALGYALRCLTESDKTVEVIVVTKTKEEDDERK